METDKFIREYFEARPQLKPPAYGTIVGYAIPAPCLHMIESLLEDRSRGSAEGTRLRIAAKAFIDEFSVDVIQEHGYQQEWNDLCAAVFSVSGSQDLCKCFAPEQAELGSDICAKCGKPTVAIGHNADDPSQ